MEPLQQQSDVAALTKEAGEFLRRQEMGKRSRATLTALYEDNYNGYQWRRFNRFSGSIYNDPYLMKGSIMNVLRYCTDKAVAAMTQAKFIPDVYTSGSSQADARASLTGRVLAQQVFAENGGNAWARQEAHAAMIRGDGFMRPEISSGLDWLVMTPDELVVYERSEGVKALDVQEFYNGKKKGLFPVPKVVFRSVHPSCVVAPNTVTRFGDAERFCVVTYQPVENIRRIVAQLGGDPEQVKAMSIGDTRRIATSGESASSAGLTGPYSSIDGTDQFSHSSSAEAAGLMEYWKKDSQGRWWVHYFTGEGFSRWVGYRGNILRHCLTHIRAKMNHSLLYGTSYLSDLIQPQTHLNKLKTAKYRYVLQALKNVWLVPRGTNFSGLSAESGDIVATYDPTGSSPIQFVSMGQQMVAAYGRMLDEELENIFLLAQLSDVSRGAVPDRVSTNTVAMGIKSDQVPLEQMWDQMQNGFAEVMGNGLFLMKHSSEFSIPRLAAAVGPDGKTSAIEFRDSDIRGDMRVMVKTVPPQVQTQSERSEAAAQLWGAGFFNPDPAMERGRQMALEYVEQGRITSFDDVNTRVAEEQAWNENQSVEQAGFQPHVVLEVMPIQEIDPASGTPYYTMKLINVATGYPLFEDRQDHAVHLDVHNKMLQDPGTSTEAKRLLMIHMQEHETFVGQKEEEAKQKELQDAARMSLAQSTGPLLSAQVANQAKETGGDAEKPKGTAADGGKKSGETRRERAAG